MATGCLESVRPAARGLMCCCGTYATARTAWAVWSRPSICSLSPDNRWLIEIELGVNFAASWAGTSPLNPSLTINVSGGANESWWATLWNIETGAPHWKINGAAKTESMAFSRAADHDIQDSCVRELGALGGGGAQV